MHQNTLGITKIQTQLDKSPETQVFLNCRGPKIDFSLLEAVAKRKKPPCAAMEDKIGDGICQRKNNNFKCDYDGGDCCRVNADLKSCIDCSCHLFTSTLKLFLTTSEKPFIPPGLNPGKGGKGGKGVNPGFIPPGLQ